MNKLQMSRQARYRTSRVANGLCGQCGHRDLATTTRCRPCADAHNARNAKRQAGLRHKGLCKVCGKEPARKGKTQCRSCAKRASGYQQTARKQTSTRISELLDVIQGLFQQTCGTADGRFDHACMSTYEEAQQILLDSGRVQRDECLRH